MKVIRHDGLVHWMGIYTATTVCGISVDQNHVERKSTRVLTCLRCWRMEDAMQRHFERVETRRKRGLQ